MKYIEIKACAKINFGLNIVSKRSDGFHNLETIFYPLKDLYDVLTFEKSESYQFRSDNAGLISDPSNLITKAKQHLERITDRTLNVDVYIKKNIPIGGGLGGGSSDAAVTLLSLNELFDLEIDFGTLSKIALELGSDVPFFLKARPSIGKSRGEILKEIDFEIKLPILVVNPGIHISTKEAYANITPASASFDYNLINTNSFENTEFLKENIVNDFESWVFRKYAAVADIKKLLYDTGAVFALMSGSGSTVFGIYKSIESAEEAKQNIPAGYFSFINS